MYTWETHKNRLDFWLNHFIESHLNEELLSDYIGDELTQIGFDIVQCMHETGLDLCQIKDRLAIRNKFRLQATIIQSIRYTYESREAALKDFLENMRQSDEYYMLEKY